MRKLGEGVLRTGFTIHNSVYRVEVPAGTQCSFGYDKETKQQVVDFEGYEIVLRRRAYRGKFGKWIAWAWGRPMRIHFPKGGTPYPVSYFN